MLVFQVLLKDFENGQKWTNFQLSLLDSIENGASFSEMAKKYSEDIGTAKSGGDQGYYKKGTLFAEFENEAFILDVGKVS